MNGSLLRYLEAHEAEVCALVYATGQCVISAGWDSKVNVHNELLPHNRSSVIRTVHW